MERSWYWRFAVVVGLVGLAIYYSLPSAIYFLSEPEVRRSKAKLAEAIPEWLPNKRFNLGIDLQGGLHLVMGVEADKALEDRADRVGDELVEQMQQKGKPLESVKRLGDEPELTIVLKSGDDWDTLKEILEQRKDTWEVASRSGTQVIYKMTQLYADSLKQDSVDQALKTLRNRIDKYGVTEPEVRKRGDSSIMIQIAGLSAEDEKSIKDDIIGKTAQLEFKIVDDTSQYFADVGSKPDKPESVRLTAESYEGLGDQIVTRPYLESEDKLAILELIKKYPPPSDRVVGIEEYKPSKTATKGIFRTWLLERRTPITGDSLTDAFPYFDSDQNTWHVSMKFDQRGAVIFEKLTRENTKKKMAIVLDDIVDSAPIIQGAIPNGNAQITLGGGFKTQEEILADAKALGIVLKAGALPAPVYPQEERTVGATMGDDAIAKGQIALLASLVLVCLIMWVYYKVAGFIGTVAMAVNMLFLFASLAAFNATLTLPGIAGLALTIGMAVDANIIQFERIRDEMALGKTLRAAVDGGFDKAFSAIFDSNVTTLIAAVVLYQYGSGPIRGFATTLGIGVLINTFTSVVVPRLIFDYLVRAKKAETISI
jgi:preprotein translocase subunit SecD